jgi:hypothetical protein
MVCQWMKGTSDTPLCPGHVLLRSRSENVLNVFRKSVCLRKKQRKLSVQASVVYRTVRELKSWVYGKTRHSAWTNIGRYKAQSCQNGKTHH